MYSLAQVLHLQRFPGLYCLILAGWNLKWAWLIPVGMCCTFFLHQLVPPLLAAQEQQISWRNQSQHPSSTAPHSAQALCYRVLVQELSSTNSSRRTLQPRLSAAHQEWSGITDSSSCFWMTSVQLVPSTKLNSSCFFVTQQQRKRCWN